MDSARLKQIEEIYHAALDVTPAGRESFFREWCGEDESLRSEVESLLAVDESSHAFIDASPESLAAEMFSDEPASLIGKKIGHYNIKSLLGSGGMGEVYLAEDFRLHRQVALKVLHENVAADSKWLRRFEREAQAASALNHPNILTVHEFGKSEKLHYLATEYIEGETLRQVIKGGKLSLADALQIIEQAAFALSSAHMAGIVHRDIKPDNIMIRRDGIVKILDFGLAKLSELFAHSGNSTGPGPEAVTRGFEKTNPGSVMGTVSYMSPEQTRGKETDAATDLWSLGVVLYEMLTRRLPFAGETTSDSIAAILTKEPPDLAQFLPDIPAELQRIVSKALTKKRGERYKTASDLMIDIKTLRREIDLRGEIESSSVPPLQSASVPRDENPVPTDHPTSSAEYIVGEVKKRRFVLLGALGILIVALATTGYFTYFRSKPINSIAVLPFVNVGDDLNGEYLSDGLSENLINNLSRLPQLKVIARSSSFKYRGENIDIQDAGQKLGVGAILTGRVVRRGDDLQISVELINTADNTHIWGDIYNRKVSAALSVPDEIAQAVSQQLDLKLSGAQERQMAKQITNSPQAYQFHLNGVFFRRKNGTDNIKKAIEYQNQAIALDPNFTLAYIELAINYGNLIDIGAMSPKEGLPPARVAAEKALALDDTLADAYYNIARIRKYEFEWIKAEQAFKRAIEINPNLAGAHTIYAEYLSQLGRFDEALREIRLAQELDPLRTGLVGNEGSIFYLARQYDEAIVKKQIHVSLAPENPFAHLELANAYVQKGQYAEAILSYHASIKVEETTSALIYLGRVYALTGKRKEATAILDKLRLTDKYVSPAELSILFAALGDTEKAFALLEKAYTERDIQLTSLKVDPAYDPLRADARFQDLLHRVGLSP